MNNTTRISRQFIVGLIAYVMAIIIQLIIFKTIELPQVGKIVIALIPMAPAIWGMMGWLKSQHSLDELQQKIAVEAGAFSLGVTAIITFSYGFLETFANFPKLSMFFVWIIISISYIIGQLLANKRYG